MAQDGKCNADGCDVQSGAYAFCWSHFKQLPVGVRSRLTRWWGAMQSGTVKTRTGRVISVSQLDARQRYERALYEALQHFSTETQQ